MSDAFRDSSPCLMDERGTIAFRAAFGSALRGSRTVEAAVLRIRLGAVDLTAEEVKGLGNLRILVAEVNARTVEEEAYGLLMDPAKQHNLMTVLGLLEEGRMEIRSAPLGGWSPDFSVFSGDQGPHTLLLGLHWFRRPFPHRGPAWAARFGPEGARRAHLRFLELWEGAHDISPAVHRLIKRDPTPTTIPKMKD
jgi:hypothetical protein